MRVQVVQDSRGRIVGTAPSGPMEVRTTLPGVSVSRKDAEEESFQVEVVLEPLEGQAIYEVDLPAELARIEDGDHLLKALSEYRISDGEARLVQR